MLLLNASQQTSHTLSQLQDRLQEVLKKQDCTVQSNSPHCYKIECRPGMYEPELALTCNILNDVLSQLASLNLLLKQEVSADSVQSSAVNPFVKSEVRF